VGSGEWGMGNGELVSPYSLISLISPYSPYSLISLILPYSPLPTYLILLKDRG